MKKKIRTEDNKIFFCVKFNFKKQNHQYSIQHPVIFFKQVINYVNDIANKYSTKKNDKFINFLLLLKFAACVLYPDFIHSFLYF